MLTSSSELLDIVDDQDQVIATLTRGEIHQRGLTHRSVHVLVFDDAGSIVLQKRSALKDECPGLWDSSCAGHVESGQSYLETAPRELMEELGIAIEQPMQELFKMPPNADNGFEFAMVYKLVHNGPFVAAEDEIDQLQWFSAEHINEWIAGDERDELTSGFKEIWNRYCEFGSSAA